MSVPEAFCSTAESGKRGIVDALLEDQSRLSAVEKFSGLHERNQVRSGRYRDLMPMSRLEPGRQFAFEVDLEKCSGCKACVTACHALNGLDEDEAWREVGVLISEDWRHPFQQFVTTACHHCIDPACLNGCPVLAYEKDPVTGIVRHLDDQCIGCQYCVLKCPYDVPKYSSRRGIVRKCDMCSQRLAVNEAPACAQACPNEAIRIMTVEQNSVVTEFGRHSESRTENKFLPGSPDPTITLPTTRFIPSKGLRQDLVPGDATAIRLQPAHWPLVVMLVLTQLGVGAFASVAWVAEASRPIVGLVGLAAIGAGLAASVFHLGRPWKAWRTFLGLKRSWLSREIVAFGLLLLVGAVLVSSLWAGEHLVTRLLDVVVWVATVAGFASVFCSAMVYHDTRRTFWSGSRVFGKFFGTTTLLGAAVVWLIVGSSSGPVPALIIVVAVLKIAGEHRLLRRADVTSADAVWPKAGGFDDWSLAHSAVLMRDQLGPVTRVRFLLIVVGGVLLPLFGWLEAGFEPAAAAACFTLCLIGEILERYMFFRAVVPPKMPGAK